QVDHIDDFKSRDRSVDIIQLERRFFHVCRTIDQLIETLEEFRHALFDETEFGISVKELYLTSNPKTSSINVRQEYQYFDLKKIGDFASKIQRYAQYAATLEQDDYPWLNRISFSNFLINDLREIKKAVRSVPETQLRFQKELEKFISSTLSLVECESLLQREPEIDKMMELLNQNSVFESFQRMVGEHDDETSLLWLQNTERVCMNCFDGVGVESTIETHKLGTIQQALHRRMESRRGLIKRIRWELSDQKFLLKRVLVENNLKFNKAGLVALEQRIDNRLNLEHHITALRDKSWLSELPLDVDQQKMKQWFDHQLKAIRAKLLFNSLRELRKAINMEKISKEQFQETIKAILGIIRELPSLRSEWSKFLSSYQIQQLISQPQLEKDYVTTLERDFDKLIEFDQIKESLVDYEKNILSRLFEETQKWEPAKLESLFQNTIRLAWIEHIETKYPILRSVSTFKMDEIQKELHQNMLEKQQLSTQIVLLRARERVYGNVEYNRLNNRVTYRDLHHQVTKKKKIWPVRKVIAEFSEELFNLMPCWMASPEAVSAIFPMTQLFDLVIFDEASQCFSERGIPAMFRAKQALVAGDSKQLRPFELYQTRWEDEHENPDLEVDSLLELSERYLPTIQLQGHYRSQSMALIDFSNQFFYDGNLKLLPDRKISNDRTPSIEFHKVTGLWENQTNPLEAQTVVRYAFDLIRKHPEKEIGIITFNAPQQMLLMDLMEEVSVKEGLTIPESLFVKNIENVQGDERDIIIFSVGYAPGKDGKMSMQFGSLNVTGGENRLNVAVTRAREKIIVISSIQAEELKLQGIKNEGPKLLKKYLEFSRQVSEGNFKLQRLPVEKHSSDWYLSKQLMTRNSENNALSVSYSLFTLPFTDVLVQQGHDQLGVLLTDDQLYHTSPTVKEPHFYTPHLLQKKNWNYLRVFSRSWWMDREKTENELSKFTYQLTTRIKDHS
ncbi:MAG TPA: AAA domain-containing protein, partial [Cyclobacteriaceae bacterium]